MLGRGAELELSGCGRRPSGGQSVTLTRWWLPTEPF
jgi:hypothetical protein